MSRLQANGILLLAAIIWGTTFVVQQIGTGGLGAITFTASRFCLGGFFILPFAIYQYNKRGRNNSPGLIWTDWIGMVVTGSMLFLGASLQQFGIFFTTVTNAGFLTALYVPLVPLIGLLFMKRRVHWSVWPASVTCLFGTYIMSGAGEIQLKVGDLWVMGSAFFWAMHVICVGMMSTRTGMPLVVAAVQFFTCATLGLIFGIFIEQPTFADFDGSLFGILYAGILSVGLGFTLQVIGQRSTNPADAAIILSTETVFAAVAGFIVLGERLSSMQLGGACLIFAGVLSVELIPMLRKARILS